MSLGLMTVDDGSWAKARINFARINSVLLGPEATPTFASIDLSGLTASRLVWTNASNVLASKDLVDLIAGTANEINVVTDGAGGVTIGLVDPLIASKGGTGLATITNHGLMLGSGTGAVTVLAEATNGQLPIGSTGFDPVLATLTGTAGQIDVTNAAGSITLSLSTDVSFGGDATLSGDLLPDADDIYDIGIYYTAPAPELQDYYNTGYDNQYAFYGVNWAAQTFTTGAAYTINSVQLRMYRIGTPGDITVRIQGTDGAFKPNGVTIATCTQSGNAVTTDTDGEWVEFIFDEGVALTIATLYAIVVSGGTNLTNRLSWKSKSVGTYATGSAAYSTNSGAVWSLSSAVDCMFETYSGLVGGENDYRRFQDIFISGDISDGTNATSAAEIAAAYAHSGLVAGNPHSVTPTELGLVIGTNVQAWDATLTSIAALGTAAGKILYTTDVDTWAESSITTYGRALIDDASYEAMRNTLGLGTGDHPQFDGLGLGEAGAEGVINITSSSNSILRVDMENTSNGNTARSGFIVRADAAQWVADAFSSGHLYNANEVHFRAITDTEFLIYASDIGGTTGNIKLKCGGLEFLLDVTNTLFTYTGAPLCMTDFSEIRFYDDGANYVGFEAPALTADKIWVLPNADGGVGELLKTDGAGNLGWTATAPPGAHTHDGDTLQLDAINSDAASFAFNTGGTVTFDHAVTLGAGADLTIAGHIIFNTNNSYVGFDNPRITFNDTDDQLDIIGNIVGSNSLFLAEKADQDTNIADHGQIWVKSGAPNTLWFSDDAGTDFQLGAAQTSHADVLVDGDFASAGLMFTDGAGTYSIKIIGTDVQAYHANLAAIVAGTWTGANSITTLGAIATVGNITIADGGTIGQAAGPLLTFDDTNNYLEITGAAVGIGVSIPESSGMHVQSTSFPPMLCERVTDNTNIKSAGMALRATSTGDMADGFGTGFVFQLDDTADSPKNAAALYVVRDGGDALGALHFMTGGITVANFQVLADGGIKAINMKSGTDQADAGAAADELYVDTDTNAVMMGV